MHATALTLAVQSLPGAGTEEILARARDFLVFLNPEYRVEIPVEIPVPCPDTRTPAQIARDEMDARIIALAEQRWNYTRIGRDVGCSGNHARNRLRAVRPDLLTK